ncbi:hypothetical protein TTHERM_00577270 (macronuclear) [Tetrahymena thermophila SB210]|uniref:Uncharacterized protein n=1 Tax=Tetrahymena thermophila (strain SB210) TaxID=312017 RepID=Q22UX6_TETTS|nr:hypothetical protein TTHERM_00577270 [Tetrahymena thermophila SB210]EAR89172.1 hypothetical protein TTHERM_00577270 [Tetrahymena thermophila SB210]|eukprot:XP_001009417.1 hypothetical protein TTHERM_00577270 [Tetrahymena thermophila SB210]
MNFQEKRIKIQTLQKKANDYNKKEDELIDAGVDPEEARSQLIFQETNLGRSAEIKQLPYQNSDSINEVGKTISQGFKDTHKVNTTYKDFNKKTSQQFEDIKEMRKSQKLKEQYNEQKKQEEDENQKRVNFYTKDHVSLMFEGVQNENKQTSYLNNYQHTQEKEKMIINADLKYHIKKNDINSFTDAFVKHKGTMRK